MRKSTKILAVVGAASITVATAGAAYAWWTTTGTGTGSATAGTVSQNLTLTASQVTAADRLYPGGSPVALKIAVSNPNTYSVSLAGTTAAITAGSIKCGATSVPDSWFTLTSTGITSETITPAQTGATPGSATLTPSGVSVQFNDVAADQNVCKSATVSFALTSS